MLDHDTATQLRRHLAELPELLVYGHFALQPGSSPRTGRVSGGAAEAPLPINLRALDLLGTRHDDQPGPDILASWARAIIDDRQRANDWTGWIAVPATLHNEASASIALRYLQFHHWFAVTRPYAVDYAEEIGTLHRTLANVAGQPIVWRPVTAVCPRCLLRTLRERTDGRRECSNPDCVAVYTTSEYRRAAA